MTEPALCSATQSIIWSRFAVVGEYSIKKRGVRGHKAKYHLMRGKIETGEVFDGFYSTEARGYELAGLCRTCFSRLKPQKGHICYNCLVDCWKQCGPCIQVPDENESAA